MGSRKFPGAVASSPLKLRTCAQSNREQSESARDSTHTHLELERIAREEHHLDEHGRREPRVELHGEPELVLQSKRVGLFAFKVGAELERLGAEHRRFARAERGEPLPDSLPADCVPPSAR